MNVRKTIQSMQQRSIGSQAVPYGRMVHPNSGSEEYIDYELQGA
jgi:hypothetical protein